MELFGVEADGAFLLVVLAQHYHELLEVAGAFVEEFFVDGTLFRVREVVVGGTAYLEEKCREKASKDVVLHFVLLVVAQLRFDGVGDVNHFLQAFARDFKTLVVFQIDNFLRDRLDVEVHFLNEFHVKHDDVQFVAAELFHMHDLSREVDENVVLLGNKTFQVGGKSHFSLFTHEHDKRVQAERGVDRHFLQLDIRCSFGYQASRHIGITLD